MKARKSEKSLVVGLDVGTSKIVAIVGESQPDGSVEDRWPVAPDRPFELRAVYRWAAPDTLDLETCVLAKTDLAKFESFLVQCGSRMSAVIPAD